MTDDDSPRTARHSQGSGAAAVDPTPAGDPATNGAQDGGPVPVKALTPVRDGELDSTSALASPSGTSLPVRAPGLSGPPSLSAAARAWRQGQGQGQGIKGRVTSGVARAIAQLFDLAARRHPGQTMAGQTSSSPEDTVALSRVGGPIARWISFPRGVRTTTAATSAVAVGLGVWGISVFAGTSFTPGAAAIAAGLGLATAAGPIGVRLANRLHRLIALSRRCRISELRGVPDRRAVAVRGVVLAIRTAASPLDERAVVWSLTRFRRRRPPLVRAFFHEVAFDFLLADGTDEPIWVEVAGGMLIDRFGADQRVQFQSTTLLDIAHPYLTDLRLRDREVRAAEISIAAGDVVEVVGRLSRRLDPTAPSDSGREPPQRRVLRSGTRVPVMIRKVVEPDLALGRVRRLAPRGAPDTSPGEPPIRRF